MLHRAALLALVTLVPGCGPLVFTCQDDAMCDREPGGVCEANAQCSYADDECPGGQRFPDDVPGVGGQCVEPDADSAGSTGTDSVDASGSAGPSGSDESTGAGPGECGLAGAACCHSGEACTAGLECVTGTCTCHDRLASGRRHSCIVDLDGATSCWGDNTHGQIEVGGQATITAPTRVVLGMGQLSLAAWEHTCVLTGDQALRCFGRNESGQAIPAGADPTPSMDPGVGSVRAIGVGPAHSCAVVGSEIVCWGSDADDRLGGGPGPGPITVETPAAVVDAQLALGDAHSCALAETAAGSAVWCWGDDSDGQLGDGSAGAGTPTPVVVALADPSLIAAGARHTCVTAQTSVYCWGANERGQLGREGATGSATPELVPDIPGDETLVGLTAGADHTCAWDEGGTVWCWGDNGAGQINPITNAARLPPISVAGPLDLGGSPRLRGAAAGEAHTCVLTSADELACWGRNDDAQLGNTDAGDRKINITDVGC